MAESLTMTRGQLHDLLARFAVDTEYREALINDPKMVLEKQLGSSLGNVNVKSVIETPADDGTSWSPTSRRKASSRMRISRTSPAAC